MVYLIRRFCLPLALRLMFLLMLPTGVPAEPVLSADATRLIVSGPLAGTFPAFCRASVTTWLAPTDRADGMLEANVPVRSMNGAAIVTGARLTPVLLFSFDSAIELPGSTTARIE